MSRKRNMEEENWRKPLRTGIYDWLLFLLLVITGQALEFLLWNKCAKCIHNSSQDSLYITPCTSYTSPTKSPLFLWTSQALLFLLATAQALLCSPATPPPPAPPIQAQFKFLLETPLSCLALYYNNIFAFWGPITCSLYLFKISLSISKTHFEFLFLPSLSLFFYNSCSFSSSFPF